MLVLYFGLTRVVLAMSRDGLLPQLMARVNPKTQTPVRLILGSGVVIALIAGLSPIGKVAQRGYNLLLDQFAPFEATGERLEDVTPRETLEAAVAPLIAGLQAANATDLIVISHGWNNDKDEARALYDAFFASAQALVAGGNFALPADRRAYVAAVIWPSLSSRVQKSADRRSRRPAAPSEQM